MLLNSWGVSTSRERVELSEIGYGEYNSNSTGECSGCGAGARGAGPGGAGRPRPAPPAPRYDWLKQRPRFKPRGGAKATAALVISKGTTFESQEMDTHCQTELEQEKASLLQRRATLHSLPSSSEKSQELQRIRDRLKTIDRLLSPTGRRRQRRIEVERERSRKRRQNQLSESSFISLAIMSNNSNNHPNRNDPAAGEMMVRFTNTHSHHTHD